MKQTLNYNIHNILKIKIVRDKKKDFLKDLNLPFSYFETEEEIDNPDIILNIGKFTPSNNDCYIVDYNYYIKDNYIYCKDFGGTARWEMEIFGFEEGRTVINYDGKVFGKESFYPFYLPQNFILLPLIEYKLAQKNYFLIHAAGISDKEGNAYILIGRPGSFKSTLTMDFVRREGFNWLGDERVIISGDKILSFPTLLITFNFKCKYLTSEEFGGLLDKIRFIKYLYHNSNYKNCNIKIEKISKLKFLFFISRTNSKIFQKEVIPIEEAIDKLVENNRAEMILQQFYKYMLAYSFIFPESQIARYLDYLRQNLRTIITNKIMLSIEIPQKYNLNIQNEILSALGGI